ncbi:NAD-P-binding protein [Russula dissimulans]|nr:NAD-P-binding protein [Russula dissimulans]
MSGFKKFAIVGAGNIGGYFAEELLKKKDAGEIDDLVIVTRPEQNKTLASRGARIAPADFSDVSALTKALAGAHVVISTITLTAIDAQVAVAEASKAAGASVFVPSEYGGPTENLPGPLGAKGTLQTKLREVGPPILPVYCGPFADFAWIPVVNLDVKGGKVSVGGDGNSKISWTTRSDLARFLAHVLVHAPASRLQNQTLRVEGDRVSFNEIFRGYEERTGNKLEVTYRSVESLRQKVAENPYDFDADLHLNWTIDGLVGEPDNGLYPGWNPTKVVDVVANL